MAAGRRRGPDGHKRCYVRCPERGHCPDEGGEERVGTSDFSNHFHRISKGDGRILEEDISKISKERQRDAPQRSGYTATGRRPQGVAGDRGEPSRRFRARSRGPSAAQSRIGGGFKKKRGQGPKAPALGGNGGGGAAPRRFMDPIPAKQRGFSSLRNVISPVGSPSPGRMPFSRWFLHEDRQVRRLQWSTGGISRVKAVVGLA